MVWPPLVIVVSAVTVIVRFQPSSVVSERSDPLIAVIEIAPCPGRPGRLAGRPWRGPRPGASRRAPRQARATGRRSSTVRRTHRRPTSQATTPGTGRWGSRSRGTRRARAAPGGRCAWSACAEASDSPVPGSGSRVPGSRGHPSRLQSGRAVGPRRAGKNHGAWAPHPSGPTRGSARDGRGTESDPGHALSCRRTGPTGASPVIPREGSDHARHTHPPRTDAGPGRRGVPGGRGPGRRADAGRSEHADTATARLLQRDVLRPGARHHMRPRVQRSRHRRRAQRRRLRRHRAPDSRRPAPSSGSASTMAPASCSSAISASRSPAPSPTPTRACASTSWRTTR